MDDVRGLMLRSVHTRCVSNIVIVRLFLSHSLTPLYRLFSDLVRFSVFLLLFFILFFFSFFFDQTLMHYFFLFRKRRIKNQIEKEEESYAPLICHTVFIDFVCKVAGMRTCWSCFLSFGIIEFILFFIKTENSLVPCLSSTREYHHLGI